ncbi:alpha-2-macroglobulin-like protein 1 isoform X2 [Hyla sarda]|uniref:alpha-2-macroglobulin-like protein 1 isoform X2 n=1 Tax=Hyla sarda TaxID=327740 RepID=UPI0024C37D49|nr:alpha-2-macroglobulin-like protein 1 isoform X2 [Hyla sarda]
MCTKLKYDVVDLKDPYSNRIFQWLDVKTKMCIADLSFNLMLDPILGNYTLSVENGLALMTFLVEEAVLPRFEVTIQNPSAIFAEDPTFPLKICGKYTYGKGVQGRIYAELCRKPYGVPNGICTEVNGQTDVTGCFQTMVDGNELQLRNPSYISYSVEISASVSEATGVKASATRSVPVFFIAVFLTFEDMDSFYKGGLTYGITLFAQGRDGAPLQFNNASLEVIYENETNTVNGRTDKTGRARFSLDTSQWSGQVTIRGYMSSTPAGPIKEVVPDAFQSVRPYYSEAKSMLRLKPIFGTIPCGHTVNIRVEYNLSPSDLMKDWASVKFYYVVIGKDGIMLHGQETIVLDTEASLHGWLSVSITFTSKFGPAPKMLGFLLLKNGSVTADRLLFNVEKCFPNQAWLKFARTEASPKAELSLHIGASARSWCSIRAVDKSVQINNEDKELTADTVSNMFNDLIRGGYPSTVQERPFLRCWWPSYFGWDGYSVDVFSLFKEIGMKILTNTHILQPPVPPVTCDQPSDTNLYAANVPPQPSPSPGVVRAFFPGTWLWDLVPIGKLGRSSIQVTVPDSITQFNARAFCMGDQGFGLSPQISLTVFKPFFVDLVLPYSIIQGETLSLQAVVFNYLRQCLMVRVTLHNSTDFSVKDCKDCMRSSCVCAGQTVTFSWNITADTIGLLALMVRAEAVTSNITCNGAIPYVPIGGRLDIVKKQLFVKPGGIKKEMAENMYLCLNASANNIQKSISLTLPSTWVEKSQEAYVSVLGDILGTALQNLDRLIVMPYGCGEQNMLTMGPTIYVLDYLKATGQLDTTQKDKGIGYLQSGYQGELAFKHNDGSYSAFGVKDEEGNTWLTAFVIKCFSQAKNYIFIDDDVLSQAVTWLGLQQGVDGCFISRGKLFQSAMKGGVNDDVSLSAYITAALLESGTPGNDPMLVRALSCLKNKMTTSSNTYTMALLGYTFALANDIATKKILLDKLLPLAVSSGADLYWAYTLQSSDGSVSASVELSSYVLLALTTAPIVSQNDILKASQIVTWLAKQQNPYGGFSSTQDTVVAIQALAKYTRLTFNSKGTLSITVSKNSKTLKEFKVDETNRLLLQTAPLPDIPGEYNLLVKGIGCVFIQSVLKYNVVPVSGPSAFSINVNLEGCDYGKAILRLRITVTYTGKRSITNMVLIEVEMVSGYQLVDEVKYQLQTLPLVKKVNVQQNLITIYLEEVSEYLMFSENVLNIYCVPE